MNLTSQFKKIKDRAKTLKTDIPAVYITLKKKETPVLAKIIAGITVVYALSPIDIIPDFIPVIGYLDDIILLLILVAHTDKLISVSVVEECRKEAENLWIDGKPKQWYFALPIVLFWIIIMYLVLQPFLK